MPDAFFYFSFDICSCISFAVIGIPKMSSLDEFSFSMSRSSFKKSKVACDSWLSYNNFW